ncbi:indole-3-acetic acid-amido synthetase GH3.6-like [Ipomoea triloba]|uniref:indole-3-acetic acid-amido synthetase GH3.6-like n=1 Tax=Ipomoea triloba TaxID=35885 RepID=UPI00125DBE4B|nr:indole-3-acetic acid-amido synthetase GH3.6-like [Ipomoea triloba]
MTDALASSSDERKLEESNNRILQFVEDVTTNVVQIQERVLNDILSSNAGVEYLLRQGLNGRTDRETFKKLIPVVTYEDVKPDIDRVVNGEPASIICSKPISEFSTSSGTSRGENKLIPMSEEELERKLLFFSLLMPVMNQFVPDFHKGKTMHFLFVREEAKTPGGLLARPLLTSIQKRSYFKEKTYNNPYTDYSSPKETILCTDSFQSMYSQMLCGLWYGDQVLRVGAIFASAFVRAIHFLEKHWRLLCHDIRTGTLNPRITDPSVREAVARIVKPNPELAEFIEKECSQESWKGIIPRIWRNTKYIDVVVTGAMAQYIPTLNYFGNDLPLVSTSYASSECCIAVNLNPLSKPSEVAYTIIPTMAYFEFLPVSREIGVPEPNPVEVVDLVDVKLGQEYEVVVTSYAGLYRYRVGDILRVAGFKNNTPQFNFVCRKNVALSIDSDKTDEVELHNAVMNASNILLPFGASIIEYTSHPNTSTIPGHYVLYWEISQSSENAIPPHVFEDCCLAVEESLNSVYRECRVSDKSIGALEIRIVENGTFDKMMDYAIANGGSSINQYKTPRCVTHAPMVEHLDSRVISNYFSPKPPEWAPGHKHWSTN